MADHAKLTTIAAVLRAASDERLPAAGPGGRLAEPAPEG